VAGGDGAVRTCRAVPCYSARNRPPSRPQPRRPARGPRRGRRIDGLQPGGVRFMLADALGAEHLEVRDAICAAAAKEFCETGQFGRLGGDDELARPTVRDPVLVTERRQPPRALDAQTRLERAWRVIDARMDDAAVVTSLMGGNNALLLENGQTKAGAS